MASQSILLPANESLFITDRSWARHGKPLKAGQSNFRFSQSSETDGLSVTIVKTGIKTGKTKGKGSRGAAHVPPSRGLQFVNTTQSKQGKQDAAVLRRVVRSHVMTGIRRKTTVKPAKKSSPNEEDPRLLEALDTENSEPFDEEIFSQYSTLSWSSSPSTDTSHIPELSIVPSGTSTPLYGSTPFKIQPHFHRLMSYYTIETASSLYPLQRYLGFNPVQRFWFPMALTDEVLLHTIMYSAAFSLSQTRDTAGLSASNDLIQLVAPILRLLKDRLAGETTINDATIGAVSCLVMVENTAGNREKSQLHLKGLQQMILARGGLENIDPGLVMKIVRADSEASVDNLTPPTLPPLKRQAPTLYETLPTYAQTPPSTPFAELLFHPDINTHISSTLLTLANFTTALNHYTHYTHHQHNKTHPQNHPPKIPPRALDEDILSLSTSLLRLLLSPPITTPLHTSITLTSLLFIKTISRGLPFPPNASDLLPKRLKQALAFLLRTTSTAVLLWMSTIGALACKPGSSEEIWFVDQLVNMIDKNPKLQDWDRARAMLKEMLFVDVVHEAPCRRLWEQVGRMYDLKKKWDKQVEMNW
jgi:hypothetical protein